MNKATQELKEAALKEAQLIKKHATPEQLNNLQYRMLSPIDSELCVYGLMTRDCFSKEALVLIRKCAIPWSDSLFDESESANDGFGQEHIRSFTAIEAYICRADAKLRSLIEYLKGDRESLTVEDL